MAYIFLVITETSAAHHACFRLGDDLLVEVGSLNSSLLVLVTSSLTESDPSLSGSFFFLRCNFFVVLIHLLQGLFGKLALSIGVVVALSLVVLCSSESSSSSSSPSLMILPLGLLSSCSFSFLFF